MSGHRDSAQRPPDPRTAPAPPRRPEASEADTSPAGLVTQLQRLAGNRAVAQLMQRPAPRPAPKPAPMPVQRDGFGWKPPQSESPYQLHLDPEIEAQIRAIQAMQTMVAPTTVQEGLHEVNLNLPPMPVPTGPQAPPIGPAPAPPASRPAAAPGTGLTGPRAGTGGDIWQAVLSEPALGPAIQGLGDQAATRAKSEWGQLSTGGTVAVVTNSVLIGGGALTGALATPDARQWLAGVLADKVIPVPKVPGLGVQLNLAGDNIIVGLHLDVGKILPAALGFGPAVETTPLGAPPNPYAGVQRQAADAPVQRHAAAAPVQRGLVVQRDPIPGGVGGATSSATGGAIGLKSIEGSFELPAGKILSSDWTRTVKTAETAHVSVQITSDKIVLSIGSGVYIDAQWPCQNMRLYSVTHTFATNQTTADVRTVDDEWGDGMIDVTGTARSSIAELVTKVIAGTPLDRMRNFPKLPPADPRAPAPTPQGPPGPTGSGSDIMPIYDPLADIRPTETLEALAANFAALPGGGGDVGKGDMSKISVGATISVNNGFEQVEGGTGLRIAAGTALSVRLDSGASVAKLQGAGQGAAALAAAADIQALHVTSSGIEVVKDGNPIATIDSVTVARGGQVKIDHVSLLGEAAEAAKTESALRVLMGGIAGYVESGGVPAGMPLGAQNTINEGKDRPVLVPGIVSGLLERKLQAAFDNLLATQGRSIIPGVDLGSVIGAPGAPVGK
jgi:hypothetical protein